MNISKQNLNIIITMTIFIALASLDNAVIGLFPPLFTAIAKDLNIHVSDMGIVSAINILFTAISSIFWGYLADKGKRKRLIIIGTIIWSISVFLTAYSTNYLQLIIFQIFTGVGLGCIGAIGFSVLTDYIPKKWLGMLMSLWGLSQGFGGIAGSVMAPIVSTYYNWRTAFLIISVLGFLFMFLYFFIKEPQKGAAEPELIHASTEGKKYNYSIEFSHISKIVSKKSNKWLMMQGFFMNVTIGTLIWLPTLYASKIRAVGYSHETALIAASYFFALLQIGGLSSMYFGYLGDKFQRRTYRGRALLTGTLILSAIPLYTVMFSLPMNNLKLPDNGNPISIFTALAHQFIFNPWILAMFILAICATAAQSSNTPNWLALITDVNLPEHRATTFSIATLVNGTGRAIGNALMGVVLKLMTINYNEPNNYVLTMILFQLFFIPAVFGYLKVSRNSGRDIRKVKSVLKRRARNLKST